MKAHDEYADVIAAKSASAAAVGFVGEPMDALYPHQKDLVRWACRRGRAAIFADTGLGKGPILLDWARLVSAHGRVLVLAPLAVAEQLGREAKRFGVEVEVGRKDNGAPITIANYDMLHAFDPDAFTGIALDESSILKAFDGRTRTALITGFARTPYRLACTATPAPNDFTELGNHAEFLGLKTRAEMLAEYFVHDGGSTQDWRIKGHAVTPFWRWVASWGAVIKSPADLGHDASAFALPPLNMIEHIVPMTDHDVRASGMLFADEARTLSEQRAVRRATIKGRAQMAAKLAAGKDPCVVWCELNDEAERVAELIPDAVNVQGSDDRDVKTAALVGFAGGGHRVMVSKPSIAGFGLNWQHCARMIFVGASHSYEQTYQAIRRCWRFGQTRPVDVHVIRSETEGAIVANYRRKEADAARMAAEMTAHVGDAVRAEVCGAAREWNPYTPRLKQEVPRWLQP